MNRMNRMKLSVVSVSVQETEDNIANYDLVSIKLVKDSQFEKMQQLQSQFYREIYNGGRIPV